MNARRLLKYAVPGLAAIALSEYVQTTKMYTEPKKDETEEDKKSRLKLYRYAGGAAGAIVGAMLMASIGGGASK